MKSAWNHQGKLIEIKNQQQMREEDWKHTPDIEAYMGYYRLILIPQVIEDYQRQSRRNKYFHLALQMTVIIASLLVSGLTSGFDTKLGLNIPWIAPALSLVVSFCTAIMGFFKFRERSFHMQQTADTIEQERIALKLGIRRYKGLRNDLNTAYAEFAEQVESLREEQRKRQQQLEQSSSTKEPQSTA